MTTVVTSVCVDTDEAGSGVLYPQMRGLDSSARRVIYWKLAYLMHCTSLRFQPKCRHLIVTNDPRPVEVAGIDVRALAQARGIEIHVLPYRLFCPPVGRSAYFRNNFYKFEVLSALPHLAPNEWCALLDSDCLWTRPLADEDSRNGIYAYDVYRRADPLLRIPHNLSRKDMGNVYRRIEPRYPAPYPVWYGSEVIAANSSWLGQAAARLYTLFEQCLSIRIADLTFSNGRTIFDNDEFLLSYLYGWGELPLIDAQPLIRRVDTLRMVNSRPTSVVWHLPAEKTFGLRALFDEAAKPNSAFWRSPIEGFATYLERHVGMPFRTSLTPYLAYRLARAAGRRILNGTLDRLRPRRAPA